MGKINNIIPFNTNFSKFHHDKTKFALDEFTIRQEQIKNK